MRKSDDDSLYNRLKDRIAAYANLSTAKEWFNDKYDRIQGVFENATVRDYVFSPVAAVLRTRDTTTEAEIQATITRVAVANAVLAGLPGKLGVGVIVCMALEAHMAYRIGRFAGVNIEKPADVWKYVGLLGGILATILWLFRQALGLAFSAFSVIPGISPVIPSEFVVTCFVGVVIWVAFDEAKVSGSFSLPARAWGLVIRRTNDLVGSQWITIKQMFSPDNISLMGHRLWAWLSGDVVADKRQAALLRGDAAAALMMGALLSGHVDQLHGPLGTIFMESIRDRFPDLSGASDLEIADALRTYTPEQMGGLISLIKGKMFEHLVDLHAHPDGDQWTSKLFDDESHPGSDIVFTNPSTGDTMEISLKATDSPSLIEHALMRFPEYDIMTTSEVAQHFSGDERVISTEFSNEHLKDITSQNLDELLQHVDTLSTIEAAGAMAAGKSSALAVRLWPYGVAYIRGKITRDELERACLKIIPSTGRAIAMRVALSMAVGPIYAWYVLARLTMKFVPDSTRPLPRRIGRLVAAHF